MDSDILMNIANMLFLTGTIRLALKVIKNKSTLKDFDFSGSLLTFGGSVVMAIALFQMGVLMAFLMALPTIMFWGLAAYYSFQGKK